MEANKVNNEFITQKKERGKPYEFSKREDGTKIIIYNPVKMKPADYNEIQMYIANGYILERKRKDITKADMIRYVKKNYDPKEQEILKNELSKVNKEDTDNGKITFMTIKSWFKDRYIYYPKGKDYKYKDQEKQKRYNKAFQEHIEVLKRQREKIENKGHYDNNQNQNNQDRNKNNEKND